MTDTILIGAPPSDAPVGRLEAAFRHIAATRMAGLPILNPRLTVAAEGFRYWRDGWYGILVTPWFMNLICLPGDQPDTLGREVAAMSSGSRRTLELPSGEYEFLAASEDSIGPYLSCSLFSPMDRFAGMEDALAVAAAAMTQLFAPAPAGQAEPPTGQPGRMERPVSRRGFLAALMPRPTGEGDGRS